MNPQTNAKSEVFAGMLLAAPTAYADEAPVSWIQYVCASHQYSITRLEKILNLRPRFHDWDLRVNRLDWLDVFMRTNCSSTTFLKAFSSDEYSSFASKSRSSSALHDVPPKYRWCAACLQEDARPYLRWWWRFPDSTHCPKHQTRLIGKCGNCQSELVLSHALMVNAGRRSPIHDLSHCQGCGLPRWLFESVEPLNPEALNDEPSIFRSRESDRTADPIQRLKNRLKDAAKVRWGQDKFLIDDFSLIVGSDRSGRRPVLSINARVFQVESSPNVSAAPNKWSSRIARWRVPTRLKMAYALRLIRVEMNADNDVTKQQNDTAGEIND